MATITLKNIPDRLYQRLKQLAKLRHRSLNSEIIFTLEKAVGLAQDDPEQLRQEVRAFRDRIAGDAIRREEVANTESEEGLDRR